MPTQTDDEGQQGADGDQLGQEVEREDGGHHRGDHAGDDGAAMRRAEARMHGGEELAAESRRAPCA